MNIPIYQVDAFASALFKGNPAAICILDDWLPEKVMQNIAAENCLAETSFLVKKGEKFHLRWFTPTVEIDLCGHATMATAFVVFQLNPGMSKVDFYTTKSGMVSVEKSGDLLMMNFPSRPPTPIKMPNNLVEALGKAPVEIFAARDLLAVYDNEDDILPMKPDMAKLSTVKEGFGVIVTAKGKDCDFVSRFFAPKAGVPEDPVTGSSHCTLVPFWAERLKKTKLHAMQLSERGGELFCELDGDRVKMSGKAQLYLRGEIYV